MHWRGFFRRAQTDAEQQQELESYIEITTDEYIARGMEPGQARLAARRKLGNLTRIREEVYQMNTATFIEGTLQDLRHAARMLRLNPAFSVTAILTLALGIGATTAIFSMVNSILLKPLPYPHSEQLVALRQMAPGVTGFSGPDGLPLSSSLYFVYAENNRAFQAMGVFGNDTAVVTGLADPEQARIVRISNGVLQALAVPPALGRWIGPDDQKPGAAPIMMLSYGYWQRRFGGSREVLGRSFSVDSKPRVIAGVMPAGFRVANEDFDLILPLQLDATQRSIGLQWRGIARLRSGTTIAMADADLARMLPIWQNSPTRGEGPPSVIQIWRITPAIRPLKDDVIRDIGTVLWTVMGTIGAVMLIACANVANLLLVRAEARQHDLAIRAAVGAGRGRIMRELLTESVLLALAGGALGIGGAYGGLQLLVAFGPASLPRLQEISLDGRALAFTFALSLIAGILLGSIPAFQYAGGRLVVGGRTLTASRERQRTRNVLAVVQVALALILLISSGLMIRTLQELRHVDPGFTHPEQIQTIKITIPQWFQADDQVHVTRTQNEILDRLAAIPGVTAAAFATDVPMDGGRRQANPIFVEGQANPYLRGQAPVVRTFKYISPGYLETMGTRLLLGRDLTWADIYNRRHFALVSENLARELWGSAANTLGKRFVEIQGRPWYEVIGVVQNVPETGADQSAPAMVYWPALLDYWFPPGPRAWGSVDFVMRSNAAGTESLLKQIRQAVWAVNDSLAVAAPLTMQEIYNQSMARTSFTLVMLAIAGAMALLLGLVGIYGVIAYAVSQRRREIGIRMALGAEPARLRRWFARRGLELAAIGIAIGLPVSAGLTRLMKSLLFGVSPLDPLAFAAAAAVLVFAAGLASFLPARRAAAVDPIEVLKAE